MKRALVKIALLTAFFAGIGWWLLLQTPSGRGNSAAFDPERMAGLETRMWQAYYSKEKIRLFGLLISAVREQYRWTWAGSARCAFHLARAAAVFGDARSDYDRVLPDLEEGYRLIHDWTGAQFDPAAMSRAELAWWTARRTPGVNSPENVGRLIAQASALLYGVNNEKILHAGLTRAQAAAIRDQAGAQAPWPEIENLLRESYQDLRDGLRQSPDLPSK